MRKQYLVEVRLALKKGKSQVARQRTSKMYNILHHEKNESCMIIRQLALPVEVHRLRLWL
jgi:hypothetical protein